MRTLCNIHEQKRAVDAAIVHVESAQELRDSVTDMNNAMETKDFERAAVIVHRYLFTDTGVVSLLEPFLIVIYCDNFVYSINTLS